MNKTSARGFDVFAHSMGSFLVMETLLSKAQRGQKLSDTGKLENIVLASPDIDMDLFRSQLSEMDTDFEGIFVLLSKDDSALKLSTRIAGGIPRVGAADAAALAELGVVAIDLSEVENSASGSHAKFAGSPEVVQVLGNGLNRSGTFSRTERSPLLGSMVRDSPITAVFK